MSSASAMPFQGPPNLPADVQVPPPDSSSAPPAFQPGGLWLRFVARFVDAVLVLGFVRIVVRLMTGQWTGMEFFPEAPQFFFAYVWSVIAFGVLLRIGYHGICVGRWGRTVGKTLVGLTVLDAKGGKAGYGQALGRACMDTMNMIAGITALIMLLGKERKTLSDLACGTRVVRKRG